MKQYRTGHTPGHVALILSWGGEYAFLTGDIAHSPLQFAHPEWNSVFCGDREQAETMAGRRRGTVNVE